MSYVASLLFLNQTYKQLSHYFKLGSVVDYHDLEHSSTGGQETSMFSEFSHMQYVSKAGRELQSSASRLDTYLLKGIRILNTFKMILYRLNSATGLQFVSYSRESEFLSFTHFLG